MGVIVPATVQSHLRQGFLRYLMYHMYMTVMLCRNLKSIHRNLFYPIFQAYINFHAQQTPCYERTLQQEYHDSWNSVVEMMYQSMYLCFGFMHFQLRAIILRCP